MKAEIIKMIKDVVEPTTIGLDELKKTGISALKASVPYAYVCALVDAFTKMDTGVLQTALDSLAKVNITGGAAFVVLIGSFLAWYKFGK